MLVYWVMLAFFAIGALAEGESPRPARAPAGSWGQSNQQWMKRRSIYSPMLIIGTLALIALIGLRYKVGGDWAAYNEIFERTQDIGLAKAIARGDPAYQALNWIVGHLGYRLWLVNVLSGAIFSLGLLRFCVTQPRPWLAFAIAIPYLVVVVGMGYTRQAVALGILMAGLARQVKGASVLNFAAYVAVAASFHATAVFMFPIVAWSARGSSVIKVLLIGTIAYVLYSVFLDQLVSGYVANYLDAAYSSQGALIRVSMNIVAAISFKLFSKKMKLSESEYKIWRNFAIMALVMLGLYFVLPSSTAVDRLSLYLIPMQVAILSRLPLTSERRSSAAAAGVIGYTLLVQFIWLNFAQFSSHWVPYRFYPL